MRRCVPFVSFVLALVVCVPLAAQAPTNPALDPDVLWKALLTGNVKFQAGELQYEHLDKEREILAPKQQPPVTILSCADSRVPPELLFNQSLGALFVLRTAGNVADDFELASIEYAISQGWTRLIVVLGHEHCGAVEAALEPKNPGTPSLVTLVERIRTSFYGIPYKPDDDAVVEKAVQANVHTSIAWLSAKSTVIRDAVNDGRVKVIPAYYWLKSGEVKEVD